VGSPSALHFHGKFPGRSHGGDGDDAFRPEPARERARFDILVRVSRPPLLRGHLPRRNGKRLPRGTNPRDPRRRPLRFADNATTRFPAPKPLAPPNIRIRLSGESRTAPVSSPKTVDALCERAKHLGNVVEKREGPGRRARTTSSSASAAAHRARGKRPHARQRQASDYPNIDAASPLGRRNSASLASRCLRRLSAPRTTRCRVDREGAPAHIAILA